MNDAQAYYLLHFNQAFAIQQLYSLKSRDGQTAVGAFMLELQESLKEHVSKLFDQHPALATAKPAASPPGPVNGLPPQTMRKS